MRLVIEKIPGKIIILVLPLLEAKAEMRNQKQEEIEKLARVNEGHRF